MLLLHIIIAIASVLLSTYLLTSASKRLLKVSYSLIAATTVSGIALIIANPAYAVRGCMAYLAYSVFVVALTRRAARTLASQEN